MVSKWALFPNAVLSGTPINEQEEYSSVDESVLEPTFLKQSLECIQEFQGHHHIV